MKRTRGRPVGSAEGELKDRIVEAAADEFARAGYAGASIQKVAEAAGCDRALVYFYFGDKAGLFEAALNEAARYRSEQMPAQPESLEQGLIYWFRRNMAEPRRIRLIMQEALAQDEGVGTPPRRLSYLNQQLAVVESFQAAGLLRSDMSPRHLLTTILALTSFPACFPKVASVSLDADDQAALDQTWSDCLKRIARLLAPDTRSSDPT
jgi:AcrR family transcriptional regulator